MKNRTLYRFYASFCRETASLKSGAGFCDF
jgi:hypothetical protein